MIEVKDLSLAYNEPGSGHTNRVIENLSLSVESAESVAIIGPSGCGKSSLLFILSGLTQPTEGSVVVDEKPVTGPRSDIALILQETGLLPWKRVWENATFGPARDKASRDKRLREALSDLGMEGMEKRFPAQLSGGEKKRVSLARALAQDASTILMDEPLSALDALTKESTQNLILELWERYKFTLLLVTHDIEEAVFLGQKIYVFAPRPTRVSQVIENPVMGSVEYRETPEFYERVQEVRKALQS